MSDNTVNWEESEDKYVIANTGPVSLSTVLYDMPCRHCGGGIEWILDSPDPDGPRWHGECYECDAVYSASVVTVVVSELE